ncbi:MAG: NTF2 fold immunity protein [Bacteroidales bacterium]|nr:NTF2 fold immunity protein [Bacteroidales bacterium]MDD3906577.1 NTF2 fold immunity protein [Bacteroidales bacterium]MDD4711806.1 NTF2 fold immunity protein [Bacteroidales bacterium]
MDKHFYFLLILINASTFIGCDHKVKTADNSLNQIVADNNDTSRNELKGIEFQKLVYSDIMKDSAKHQLARPILIKDSITLIHIIEPILFDIYGEKQILSERPYEVHLFGDNWLVMGTLTKDCDQGGTFEVVINRKTCEIIHLIHGK